LRDSYSDVMDTGGSRKCEMHLTCFSAYLQRLRAKLHAKLTVSYAQLFSFTVASP